MSEVFEGALERAAERQVATPTLFDIEE